MKQIIQPIGGGDLAVVDAPVPMVGPTEILVATSATAISAGTELAVTALAQSSLVDKARARPDLVRQVIRKARTEGVKATADAVRTRLASDLPLGYSGAGVVIEVGESVSGFRVGQRVATAGGGYANHADYQAVPALLAAVIPDNVTDQHAALSTVAAIGLHGLRQADVGVGDKVVVVGLGLIGQLTARLAQAAGCDVAGIDVRPSAIARAQANGVYALREDGDATTAAILEWSRGRGADAVLITAGGAGDSTIVRAQPARCRDRATIVAVGTVGLDLDRASFYDKELDLRLARSYGPGRYDASYEEWGVDYPIGHVRWTEGRNLEAVLDQLSSGRLVVDDLVTHAFPIAEAPAAYATAGDPAVDSVGIVLTYDVEQHRSVAPKRTIERTVAASPVRGRVGVGLVGAGLFARSSIIPGLEKTGATNLVHIGSASGLSATRLAERADVAKASSDPAAVIGDPDVDLVAIATPHSTHADLVVQVLEHDKHVYVEKPLAVNVEEFEQVKRALAVSKGLLHVGFNRRWSPMVVAIKEALGRSTGPVVVDYRVMAGRIPANHWYLDRREGGRLIGEVCHFIDTVCAIVDSAPTTVAAHGPQGDDDSVTLLIGFADGSSGTVAYVAGGHPSTPKERCEVLGRGTTAVLDNYRALEIDGAKSKVAAGKGHDQAIAAFVAGCRRGEWDSSYAMTTTAVAFAAVESLVTGHTIVIDH